MPSANSRRLSPTHWVLTMNQYSIRAAIVADAPIITAHRRAMFEDRGERAPDKLDAMGAVFQDWVTERLARGE